MTRIYCTKKLQGFIGNTEQVLPENMNKISINDWNAHLFFIDKRKCIIFVNNLTYYTLFLTDILKKDLKNINRMFREKLQEQLVHDKVVESPEFAKTIFPVEETIFYNTNNNKKVIGHINDFIYIFKTHCLYKYGDLNNMNTVHENEIINHAFSRAPGDTKRSLSRPVQNLKEYVYNRQIKVTK